MLKDIVVVDKCVLDTAFYRESRWYSQVTLKGYFLQTRKISSGKPTIMEKDRDSIPE